MPKPEQQPQGRRRPLRPVAPPPAPADARPVAENGDLANLPRALEPLKNIANWVVWKYEWRVDKHGNGRWTKPPYQPDHPDRRASNNDPTTWGTYQQALAVYQGGGFDGIGFNLLGTDFGAFDLDKCRDPTTGDILPVVRPYIERAESYTEISVSGTGMHTIGYAYGNKLQRKQMIPGTVGTIESYRKCERYVVVTGMPLPGTLERWPNLINIDAAIDSTVMELDAVSTTAGNGAAGDESISYDLDTWIAVNGKRYETDNDFLNIDDRGLPPQLKAILGNKPPAKDMSTAFHNAVCWLHNDLKWSARKIDSYIESAPVVPARYDGRLQREIYRCLHNSDQKKARAEAANGDTTAPPTADAVWDPWHETLAPRLDMTLLPDVVRQAAEISATVSGADLDAFAIGYLLGLAVCADTRLRINPKLFADDWSVPLLLWVLLVAPPASMKSEVIKAARALAASLDAAERERHKREMAAAGVGAGIVVLQANEKPSKAEMKRLLQEAKDKVGPPRQRVCGDITIEKFVDLLGDNPGGIAMIRDELSGWLDGLGRYSKTGKDGPDRAFYCALRDGTAHDRQRMSSPSSIAPEASLARCRWTVCAR